MERSTTLMLGGVCAISAGWLTLMAMTIRVIPPAFLAAFSVYAVSFAGFAAALLGVYMKWERRTHPRSSVRRLRSR